MKIIYVLIMYISYKDGTKSGKHVLHAFESESKAKNFAKFLSCSYDEYDVVVYYEPIDLF